MERQQRGVTGIRDGAGDGRLLAPSANGFVGATLERRKWEESGNLRRDMGARWSHIKAKEVTFSTPDSDPAERPGMVGEQRHVRRC